MMTGLVIARNRPLWPYSIGAAATSGQDHLSRSPSRNSLRRPAPRSSAWSLWTSPSLLHGRLRLAGSL